VATLILITGGARSGKSDYALQRAESIDGPHAFIATCPVIDGEMDERIFRHKEERSTEIWQTIEQERDIVALLPGFEAGTICLLDCLTLWINNLMYHSEQRGEIFSDTDLRYEVQSLLDAVEFFEGTLICVSNEVGMGVVPDNPQGRRYRDFVGRCNRMIAEKADQVILVSCGLPLFLKKEGNYSTKVLCNPTLGNK
jgi:adenosylcobinamide kinase/adenosylcobinamide-phosphate guanylyltransferase